MSESILLAICITLCVIAIVFILWILSRFETINNLEDKIEELEKNFDKTAVSIVEEIDMLYESVIDNKCSCNKGMSNEE